MSDYTYAAAGSVAPSVLQHLSLHVDVARSRGEASLGSVPDERAIVRMIDAAFWASLRREEGMAPKTSLAFVRRDEAIHPLVLERAVPLEPAAGGPRRGEQPPVRCRETWPRSSRPAAASPHRRATTRLRTSRAQAPTDRPRCQSAQSRKVP